MLLLEQATAAAEAEEDAAAAQDWTLARASHPTTGRAGIAALLGPVRAQLYITMLALLPWLCMVHERSTTASDPPALELQSLAGGAGVGQVGIGARHAAEEAALASEAVSAST